MTSLEVRIAAQPGCELVVFDGPLRGRSDPCSVGYVKTQHVQYLPDPLMPVLMSLGDGERTPLFHIGGRSFSPLELLPAPARPEEPAAVGRRPPRAAGSGHGGRGGRPRRHGRRHASPLRQRGAQGAAGPAEPLPDRRARAAAPPPPRRSARPRARPARRLRCQLTRGARLPSPPAGGLNLGVPMRVRACLLSAVVVAVSFVAGDRAGADQPDWFIDEAKLPFDALTGATAYWGVHAGAGYRIEVPDNWNGELVLYAHGFRGERSGAHRHQPVDPDPPHQRGVRLGGVELPRQRLRAGHGCPGHPPAAPEVRRPRRPNRPACT